MGHCRTSLEVRAKSLLTTGWVSGKASPITDSGNTPDTDQDFTSSTGTADKKRLARKFTATTTSGIISVTVTLGKTGAPAGTIKMAIYTDSSSFPSLRVGDFSDDVTATDLSAAGGGASQTFTWSLDSELPSLTVGEDYWIVLWTTDYVYANGVTEIRWRTDANGAVAASEFAKYQEGGGPQWTTSGTDVGADIVVTHEDVIIPLGNAIQLVLELDATQGDSTGIRLKIEFARERLSPTWFQEPVDQLSDNVMYVTALEHGIEVSDVLPIAVPVMYSYAKISVMAVAGTTGQIGVYAMTGFV